MSLVLPSLAWRIHRRPPHVESAGQTVRVPELPEVESAPGRYRTARSGPEDRRRGRQRQLGVPAAPSRRDPGGPGRTELTAANRRGKSMACETSGVGRSRSPGPELGIHLGMSGRILIMDADGASTEGGDWLGRGYARAADAPNRKPIWDRFTITFADGGTLRLFDKRRLGRVRLDPELDDSDPTPEMITAEEFADRIGRGRLRSRPDCWTRASSPGSATCSPTKHCGRPGSRRAGRPSPCPRTSWRCSAGRCARRPRRRSSTVVSIPAGSSSTARPADTARVVERR